MRVRQLMGGGMFMAIAVAGLAGAAPATAQAGTVITIFGNDKCPTSNGEQTNICVRAPESERYRIPEKLRTTNDAAPAATARVDAMQATGRSGIGSCSVGNGSFTGCQLEEIRRAAAEKRAAKKTAPVIE
ncbi:MAG TPA: hypothetical protein VF649_06845 [Sphingomonas sp.]|jgi:hypothetical protein|uniref:hypothetical protein n=1 Tax=Sphingomonas sp. TaxID=28214 RepID=UPI002ED7C132